MTKIEHIIKSKKFEHCMLFCLLGYAMFKISYRPLNDIFQTILLLGFFVSIYYDRAFIKKDPMVKLFGLALIVQIAAWVNGTYFTPYTPELSFRGLPQLFAFIPIAYFLKGNPKYIIWTLVAFCLGGILTVFIHNSTETLHLLELGLFHDKRINLLLNHSNHPGLLGGSLLLIAILLFTIIWQLAANQQTSNGTLFLLFVVTLCSFIMGVIYVYISQARTTYLALFVTIICTPLIYHLLRLNIKKIITRALPITLLMLIASALIGNIPNVHKRLFAEQQVWQQLVEGELTDIKKSSIGFRIRFWLGAKEQLQKSPILGFGDTVAGAYSQNESKYISKSQKLHYRFIHNGHLEILLAFGFLGLFVLWGSYFFLLRTTLKVQPEYQYFVIISTIALTLYLFISNSFESYYIYKQGIFIHNIFFGCIYTLSIFQNCKNSKNRLII